MLWKWLRLRRAEPLSKANEKTFERKAIAQMRVQSFESGLRRAMKRAESDLNEKH